MKAYKIEIFIIDMDGLGKDGVVNELENANFTNDCISIKVKDVQEVDIGEWHDDHPLNKRSTADDEYKRLFPKI